MKDITRVVVDVRGRDAMPFLQGLVTADLRDVVPGSARWSGLLNAEGRFLFDFMMIGHDNGFFLTIEASVVAPFISLLERYRLRGEVVVESRPEVTVVWCEEACSKSFPDPRSAQLGHWILKDNQGNLPLPAVYHERRYACGVSEGQEEIGYEKGIVLEHGWDAMGAIGWNKGCYLGQELMARTKHAGVVRKSVYSLVWDGGSPTMGETLLRTDGKPVGRVIAVGDKHGLGLLRTPDLLTDIPSAGLSSNFEIRIEESECAYVPNDCEISHVLEERRSIRAPHNALRGSLSGVEIYSNSSSFSVC